MEPRIHVLTLAVGDLERALAFYRDGLGLSSPGVVGSEFVGSSSVPAGAVAMFELEDGLILALYPRSELAKDANVPLGASRRESSASGISGRSSGTLDATASDQTASCCSKPQTAIGLRRASRARRPSRESALGESVWPAPSRCVEAGSAEGSRPALPALSRSPNGGRSKLANVG